MTWRSDTTTDYTQWQESGIPGEADCFRKGCYTVKYFGKSGEPRLLLSNCSRREPDGRTSYQVVTLSIHLIGQDVSAILEKQLKE